MIGLPLREPSRCSRASTLRSHSARSESARAFARRFSSAQALSSFAFGVSRRFNSSGRPCGSDAASASARSARSSKPLISTRNRSRNSPARSWRMPLRLFAFASTFVPSTLAVPTRSGFGSFASGSTSGNAAETASKLLRRNVQIVSWSG